MLRSTMLSSSSRREKPLQDTSSAANTSHSTTSPTTSSTRSSTSTPPTSSAILNALPPYSEIDPNDLSPFTSSFLTLLDECQQRIDSLLDSLDQQSTPPTWEQLIRTLEQIDDPLHKQWQLFNHLHAVIHTEALRKAHQTCLPALTRYSTALSQRKALYQAYQALHQSPAASAFSASQQHLLKLALRDFKLAGVGLPPDEKKTFAQLTESLATLSSQFENHVLDATQAWTKCIRDRKQLSGVSENILATWVTSPTPTKTDTVAQIDVEIKSPAASTSHDAAATSSWTLTLAFPCYYAILTQADNAELRQEMYTAYCTRASDQGPHAHQFDNTEVMDTLLRQRYTLAQCLDYPTYAHYGLATKMVKQPDDVMVFLEQLVEAARPQAEREFAELIAFVESYQQHSASTSPTATSDDAKSVTMAPKSTLLHSCSSSTRLNSWDIPYYSEKYRQQQFGLSQEALRPYFPAPTVINGLFTIVERLFELTIKPILDAPIYHPDVTCYALYDHNDNFVSAVYFDLYARPTKRGGAWMDEYCGRRQLSQTHQASQYQHPVAWVTCNFNGPTDQQPALLTHDDVVTLFHEFGHALQQMLTTVDEADVAGLNGIPWDAVEVCSQFLENWAWQAESIALVSGHYQTGEPLPPEKIEQLQRAKHFQSAMQLVRQLEFALFDIRLHSDPEALKKLDSNQNNFIQSTLDSVRRAVSVTPIPDFNRFQHAFSHIFAGGYAAGYYSYLWAEVMACDAFDVFLKNGLFSLEDSRRFRDTFLASGGAIDPKDVFITFRGRPPSIDALLRHKHIIKGA